MSRLQFKLVELLFPQVDRFMTRLIEENAQYHTELIRKANECDSMDTTLAHKEERIEDLEIEVEGLEGQVSEALKEFNYMYNEYTVLEDVIDALKLDNKDMEEAVSDYQKITDVYKSETEYLKSELRFYVEENKRLKKELGEK